MFQFKHWLCDYPLQTPYMLQKFNRKGWVHPLYCHASVHAAGTLLISFVFLLGTADGMLNVVDTLRVLTWVSILDLTTHFIIDRVKAHPDLGGRYTSDNPKFWWCLGADQMLHHLTHYGIIAILMFHVYG